MCIRDRARLRQLEPGDKVLILLPTDSHKLLMQWKGPFEVVERVGITDYKVKLESGVKVFHINQLKQYFTRDDDVKVKVEDSFSAVLEED